MLWGNFNLSWRFAQAAWRVAFRPRVFRHLSPIAFVTGLALYLAAFPGFAPASFGMSSRRLVALSFAHVNVGVVKELLSSPDPCLCSCSDSGRGSKNEFATYEFLDGASQRFLNCSNSLSEGVIKD